LEKETGISPAANRKKTIRIKHCKYKIMHITLDQIKEDIQTGKYKMIYYSTHTLWWTHDVKDLEEATTLGRAAQKKMHEAMMRNPSIPKSEKKKIKSLFKLAYQDGSGIPLDPFSSPLYQADDPEKWLRLAEEDPAHFGSFGIHAFLKTHHQNSGGKCFTKWDQVSEQLKQDSING
jgi:hypothetical protein